MNLSSEQKNSAHANYASRTAEYYLSKIPPDVLRSLRSEQLAAFERILEEAIPKPSPKIVDLRFVVDLIFSRYYVVLFVGKDRRAKARKYAPSQITKIGNIIAASIILVMVNLTVSAFILLTVYLVKSAIGIDLFPSHFPETVKHLFSTS